MTFRKCLLLAGGLLLAGSALTGCPLTGQITTDTGGVNLAYFSPEAAVNLKAGVLDDSPWRAFADDPRVKIMPRAGTQSGEVRIGATDCNLPFTATVTFLNTDYPQNRATVAVSVTGMEDADLAVAYGDAVADAAVMEPTEAVNTLTPIRRDTSGLIWRGAGASEQVLMVTWTQYTTYDGLAGKSAIFTTPPEKKPFGPMDWESWVTPAPAVGEFCALQNLPCAERDLRLKQLLGLPPESEKTRFVEFWVSPKDLFRPAPDSEITDNTAGLRFPADTDPAHVAWFQAQRAYSTDPATPYPWTGLGYTYDWGNPLNHVGLSEYVVREGAVIDILAVWTNDEYCPCVE